MNYDEGSMKARGCRGEVISPLAKTVEPNLSDGCAKLVGSRPDNALRVLDKSGEVAGRGYLGAVNSDGTTSGEPGMRW